MWRKRNNGRSRTRDICYAGRRRSGKLTFRCNKQNYCVKIFLGNPNPILLELCCFHDFMSLPTKKLQYKNAAVNDLESLFGMQSEASNEGLSWTDCSLSRTLHFWKKPKEFCLIYIPQWTSDRSKVVTKYHDTEPLAAMKGSKWMPPVNCLISDSPYVKSDQTILSVFSE